MRAVAQRLSPAVIPLNLRELFEARNGKLDDGQYRHLLHLALDDQRQYAHLSDEDVRALEDPARYPPNTHDTERLDGLRERLLEAMEIIWDILKRRSLENQ
jgi:hypothetical protein